MDGRPYRRSGSGQDALPKVREALPYIREWSGDPHRSLGMVGRPSRRSVIGREAFPKVQVWSEGPPKDPGLVGRSSRQSGSGRELKLTLQR